MIEAKALRWLMILSAIIGMTLVAPPVGILLIFGLIGCGTYRLSRRIKRGAAERSAQRQVHWTPDRIRRTYYG